MCRDGPDGYDRRMSALSLSRVGRGAGTALAWGAAAAYPLVMLVAFSHGRSPSQQLETPVAAGLTVVVLLLLRRRALVAHAMLLLGWILALLSLPSGGVAGLLVLFTDASSGYIAATRPRKVSVAVAAATCLLQAASVAAFLHADEIMLVTVLLAMGVTFMAGTSVRTRRAHAEAMREQATARAVAAERLRIARELHDMVAHSIGIIAIQAGVGG
ncbi:sensor histidine kinase, partial [Actinomadura sp. DSM 109109]|nr:sensor histidine kinase [Actinomadura lepetitiana]